MRSWRFIQQAVLVLAAQQALAEEPAFAIGDWLLVRSRLTECPTWEKRVIDVHRIRDTAEVELLDLGYFRLVGRTPEQIRSQVVAAYRKATGREPPTLSIERVEGFPYAELEVIRFSFKMMASRSCPESLPARRPPLQLIPRGSSPFIPIPPADHSPDELLYLRTLAWSRDRS